RGLPLRGKGEVQLTLTLDIGEGSLWTALPIVKELSLVPLRDGLIARYRDRFALVTPEELRADGGYGVLLTPISDLRFGTDIDHWIEQLAHELQISSSELSTSGFVRRFQAFTVAANDYPRGLRVTETNLRRAAAAGAEFLLRHQHSDGRFTYIYDG